ncbi:MAG TPA: hypothetical protein VJ854_06030 [Sphaerochaeta sp.]|nr:hypothetical protein [Sphaerochaeta sp.]
MRKSSITIFLTLVCLAIPLFAVTDTFTVSTTVADVGKIKVSSDLSVAATERAFEALGSFTNLSITTAGEQEFSAYVSTLSNSRTGYTVSMKANAMRSDDSYIDYTITVNSVAVTTKGATPATEATIVTAPSLAIMETHSHAITLSVDPTSLGAALSGAYTGTVTFTYAAT